MARASTTIVIMLVVMLSINIGLAMYQEGTKSINADSAQFMDVENTPYQNYIEGGIENGSSKLDESYLPSDVTGTESDNEDWNLFQKAKSWFQSSKLGQGLGFIGNMMGQPGGFMKDIGIPNSIALAFQVIWSVVFIFLTVSFFIGR